MMKNNNFIDGSGYFVNTPMSKRQVANAIIVDTRH